MDQSRSRDDLHAGETGPAVPDDWKWRALFDVPPAMAPLWSTWMAAAMHAEQLATLRHWAHRNDRAA